jgi:hypothetical protein
LVDTILLEKNEHADGCKDDQRPAYLNQVYNPILIYWNLDMHMVPVQGLKHWFISFGPLVKQKVVLLLNRSDFRIYDILVARLEPQIPVGTIVSSSRVDQKLFMVRKRC